MTVRELIEQLESLPPDAQVHLEVFMRSGDSNYGHALGATHSEPSVVVVSNRRRA